MASNCQTPLTDRLLFIVPTFFMPPIDRDVFKLPLDVVNFTNPAIHSEHPWVVFNRSLSSLCTLKASANNVFAIMLLPSQNNNANQRAGLGKVDKVRFLCAENLDRSQTQTGKKSRHVENDNLRQYVGACLDLILRMSEEAEKKNGEHSLRSSQVVNDLINHVYLNGWPKFCARMMKTNNRGNRLQLFLQDLNRNEPDKPSNLPRLIDAVSRILAIVTSNPVKLESAAHTVHEACTIVYKEAFEDEDMNTWLASTTHFETRSRNACDALRILSKMIKLRNGIEHLIRLVQDPIMQRTFQAARATRDSNVEQLITWIEGPLLQQRNSFTVNLSPEDPDRIKEAYNTAIMGIPREKQGHYASTSDMWDRIQKDMEDTDSLNFDRDRISLDEDRKVFKLPKAPRNQHCEGKLLRHVTGANLLGKIFPYIGCSKRCCEPCFAAIMAVNMIIRREAVNKPRKEAEMILGQCFAVADTHRKVYPNFGITPLDSPRFRDFTQGFNARLCLDIGQVVKAGARKGYGDSDSAPEP